MARDPAWVVSVQHDFGGLGLPWLHLWYPAPLGLSGQQCIEGEAACVNRLSNHRRNLAETILAARVICRNPQFCHKALWWRRHVSRKQYWYRRVVEYLLALGYIGYTWIHCFPQKIDCWSVRTDSQGVQQKVPSVRPTPEVMKGTSSTDDPMTRWGINTLKSLNMGWDKCIQWIRVYTNKCCKSMQVIAKVIQDIVVIVVCHDKRSHEDNKWNDCDFKAEQAAGMAASSPTDGRLHANLAVHGILGGINMN